MNQTLDVLERAFAETLALCRFRKLTRQESRNFGGGFAVYATGKLQLRLVSDRGRLSVDVGRVGTPDEWYDLNLIRNHVQRRDMLEVASADELALFTRQEFALLVKMFTDQHLETKELMKDLQQERVKRLFPNL